MSLAQLLGGFGAAFEDKRNMVPPGGPRPMANPIMAVDPNDFINPDSPLLHPLQQAPQPPMQPMQQQPSLQMPPAAAAPMPQGDPVAQLLGTGPRKKPGGLRHFLGQLGDALLVGGGAEAIYGPRIEREERGRLLSQYLSSVDPLMAEVARGDTDTAMTLFNSLREDRKFDRASGQDDQRIGISLGQLDLGRDELGERARANQASEGLTQRGQDVSAHTQERLAILRAKEAAAQRAFDDAVHADDREHALAMLDRQQAYAREIANLGGAPTETETVVEEHKGSPAKPWYRGGGEATPDRKTTTVRTLARVASEAQYDALPSGALFTGPDGLTRQKP